MSQENVEIVRRAFEQFQRTGWQGMLGTFWTPDMVWDMSPTGIPGFGTYRGYDGIGSFFEGDWFAAFDEWDTEVEELIDCGERVVAVARQHGRGSTSGANAELEYAQVITLRDGKITRTDNYLDRAKALEAARLSE